MRRQPQSEWSHLYGGRRRCLKSHDKTPTVRCANDTNREPSPAEYAKSRHQRGCRSLRSVDSGLRPNASEISLPAPLNFSFGEDHVSSAIFVVLTLCTSEVV